LVAVLQGWNASDEEIEAQIKQARWFDGRDRGPIVPSAGWGVSEADGRRFSVLSGVIRKTAEFPIPVTAALIGRFSRYSQKD
jgi:hypothetical protein